MVIYGNKTMKNLEPFDQKKPPKKIKTNDFAQGSKTKRAWK